MLLFIVGFFHSMINFLYELDDGDVISEAFAKSLINLRSGKFVPVFPWGWIKKNNWLNLVFYGSNAIMMAFIVGLLILIPIPQSRYVRHIGDLSFGTEQFVVFNKNDQEYRAHYWSQDSQLNLFAKNNKDTNGSIEVYQGSERVASFYESFKSDYVKRDLKFVNPQEMQIATVIQYMIFTYQMPLTYVSNPRDAVLNQLDYLSEFVDKIEVRHKSKSEFQDQVSQDDSIRTNTQVRSVIVATIKKQNMNLAEKSETQLATLGVPHEMRPDKKTTGESHGPIMVVRDPSITPADVDRVKRLFVERVKGLVISEIPKLDLVRPVPSPFERRLFYQLSIVARLKYTLRETLNGVYETSIYIFFPLYEIKRSLRETFFKGANNKKPLDAESGRGTSLWGLKLAEWVGSKVDPDHGRERFGAAYKRFAALIEWSFSTKVAFWGFMGTLAFAAAGFGWVIAPVAGLVYGILFVASHFLVPESMAPVTKVNVGVVQVLTMGVIYGVLIGVTPFLLGAVPLLGVPEFGVQAAGVLWGLAGSLHFSFDKENPQKEGEQAAGELVTQLSGVRGAFESMMPGVQKGHTDQIVGKESASPDPMTEILSRLKTDQKYRAGFVEALQKAIGDQKHSQATVNLLSTMVMAATGQPIVYVHVLGKSPPQELRTFQGLIEQEGKTSSGFSFALVVSESQRIEFKTLFDVFEARGVGVFSVDIKEQGWSKEVLMGLDDKMAPFLAQANGIVATMGEKVGINLTDVEALNLDSKLRAALRAAMTLGDVAERWLRLLRVLASNA